jgi:hypothetical protein
MRIHSVGRVALLTIALIALLAGCSDNRTAEVTGTVSLDGKLVEKGSISFIPEDGNGVTGGGEIKDGKYIALKVSPGSTKVQIRVPKVVGSKKLYNTPDSPSRDVLEESLPKRFNDKTDLRFDVQPGKNEKNWELKTH